MTGMTPERLDLIRDRIDYTSYAPWKGVTDELLDEVRRLRAGIEALHRPEPFHDDPTATFCAHCQRTAGVWPCPTAALLNPTEGQP